MSVISMKQLLEAGVHFGHQTRRWNPKMAEYIYTERNGIYIIDLQKSVGKVDEAYNAVKDIVANGGSILFVGTKKQAQDSIKTEAERCGMYYVNERWLGGMLTNFKTIQTRIKRLKEIETMSEDGTFDVLPKKEVILIKKEWDKLEKNLGGIKDMKKLPDAIFVVDPKKERICIQEAHTLGIPLIGIADTNCDPEELDYVIPVHHTTACKIITFSVDVPIAYRRRSIAFEVVFLSIYLHPLVFYHFSIFIIIPAICIYNKSVLTAVRTFCRLYCRFDSRCNHIIRFYRRCYYDTARCCFRRLCRPRCRCLCNRHFCLYSCITCHLCRIYHIFRVCKNMFW